MNTHARNSLVLTALSVGFLALAAAFAKDMWGKPAEPGKLPACPPEFTNTATVRLSAADLFRTEGDTSGFSCYSCHDAKKTLAINYDAGGSIILDEAHKDIVVRHGRNHRNDYCFNCHNPANLEQLRVRDGQTFKMIEGNKLCGSCHGPTFDDWEKGVHGRTSGFWDRKRGQIVRADCTSCHDPHAPAFPPIQPGPPPHGLHAEQMMPRTERKEP